MAVTLRVTKSRFRGVGIDCLVPAKVEKGPMYVEDIWDKVKMEMGNDTGNRKCCIMIPVYKTILMLSKEEKSSIKQCIRIWGEKYNIILCHPLSLDINTYRKHFNYKFFSLGCADGYFKRQKTYSNLCEDWKFYDKFKDYSYMMIYQPDAWVFEDKLEYFIDLGYDYIGGVHLLKSDGNGGQNGNGGFCLRKVSKMVEVCKKVDWKKVPFGQLEDCAFTQRFKNEFNLAPVEVSFKFGWQEYPVAALKRNNNRLPMGCHAFKKRWSFWSKYIRI